MSSSLRQVPYPDHCCRHKLEDIPPQGTGLYLCIHNISLAIYTSVHQVVLIDGFHHQAVLSGAVYTQVVFYVFLADADHIHLVTHITALSVPDHKT